MRPTLGLVLAIVFVGLLALDPIVCADGCRDDGGTTAPVARTGCVICLGLGPVVNDVVVTPGDISRPSVTATRLWPDQLLSHRIEHPPRHA